MLLRRLGIGALCALPGALTAYFAFNAGGFFPRQPAIVAVFLALTLVAWTTLADEPYAGLGPALGFTVAAFALYTFWVLISRIWSHSPGRSFVEFDRALVYLLAMVLFGSVATSAQRLRWMLRGLALAILVVCAVALATRLFPDSFEVAPSLAINRLSFPVTYWNALGLLAALGIVLALHLTASPEEPKLARVIACAVLPLLTATLYFTFGRGAIVVAILGVITYCAVARSRLLLPALLAAVPPAGFAILSAYHANQLASLNPTTPAAAAQGHHLAVILGGCVLAAALLRTLLSTAESRLLAYEVSRRLRTVALGGLGVVIVCLVAIALAAGAPHALATQYDRFISGSAAGNGQDLRSRLLDPANNGRTPLWKIALQGFRAAPLHGQGAGTYEVYANQHQPVELSVVNAHSLYLENLADLGIVGTGLLVAPLLMMLVGAVRRARAPNRGLYAAVFAAFLAWAIHAGEDWDWQMPVVTIGALSLGAAALNARVREPRTDIANLDASEHRWSESLRIPVAIGWLAVAVTPALVSISHAKTVQAADALINRACPTARAAAFSSIGTLGGFSAPYEVIGYCDLQMGLAGPAMAAMREAIKRDPNNWEYHEGLAIARAAAGMDPRSEAQAALRLNPLYDTAQQVTRLLRRSTPAHWPSAAATARGLMLNNVQIGQD